MPPTLRFVLVLHNHQPVGNFDGVVEQAYQDAYRPFLDVFERYPSLKVALHTSGSLMSWLEVHHPEYITRLAELVAAGRIEIVGLYYEPILTMIPPRDRAGQISSYSAWLQNRLGAKVRGIWIPERVWEPSLASDIAAAGLQYTVLDDFHFKNAGLEERQLSGYYVTEDDGRLLAVLPGSERLRYLIPFSSPQETIGHLRHVAEETPGAVIVFGDDGEKFGVWPETHRHVYTDGWLVRFFDLLVANQDWIHVTTLAETVDNVPPLGRIYLPNSSYREMTEWVLPPAKLIEYEEIRHELEHHPRWRTISQFLRGGFWRNYLVKYPESNEMYSRMMVVSRRLQAAIDARHDHELVELARTELYRGQCNCSYWHGAFGGIYLPHLRNAIYRSLIAAENLLDRAAGRAESWIEATSGDFNFDARQEVYLSNDKLAAWISPHRGGQIYELDVRSVCHNLLATLARRPEAYHRKVQAGNQASGEQVASIHDRVVFKQPGLDQRLQYDQYPRKSLLDHFYDLDVTPEAVAQGQAAERGDFVSEAYEARIRRNPDRIQVQLVRTGNVLGQTIKITKGVTLEAGASQLEIAYLLEGLPRNLPLHFAVELNFSGLPPALDDRYFRDGRRRRMGHFGTRLHLDGTQSLGLVDEAIGIDVSLDLSRPSRLWAFPIETVSQSEGGFELVHQSVAILPHWIVEPDADGRWSVIMTLSVDASLAESRMEHAAVAAAT